MKHLQNILEGYAFQASIFETPKIEQGLVSWEKFAKNIKVDRVVLFENQSSTTCEW